MSRSRAWPMEAKQFALVVQYPSCESNPMARGWLSATQICWRKVSPVGCSLHDQYAVAVFDACSETLYLLAGNNNFASLSWAALDLRKMEEP